MCLNIGQREKLLSSIAPYLFAYDPESEFGKWLLAKGWGNSWGMFEVAIEFELENGKLISKKVLKQDFWNRLNGTISAATADTEIKTEQPNENKDKPGRKWNFLID